MSNLFKQSKLLRIKSSDKTTPTSSNSDFQVAFNNYLDLHNVRAVSIKSISFPNLFYNIPTQETFAFTLNGTAKTTTIPVGQYTLGQLFSTLKVAMDATITPLTSTFFLSDTTKKVTIYVSSGTLVVTSNTFSKKYLGFSSDLSGTSSVTAQDFPNLGGEKTIYIHSNALSDSKYLDSSGNQAILCEVPVVAPFGYLNLYESNSSDEIDLILYKFKRNINSIDLSLRDENGKILELGNQELRIVIKIFYNH